MNKNNKYKSGSSYQSYTLQPTKAFEVETKDGSVCELRGAGKFEINVGDLQDVDLVINCTGMALVGKYWDKKPSKVVREAPEWFPENLMFVENSPPFDPPDEIVFEWKDMSVPDFGADVWLTIADHIHDNNLKSVQVCCTAGKGRTGTVLTILRSILLDEDPDISLRAIRKDYYNGAVETEGQECYTYLTVGQALPEKSDLCQQLIESVIAEGKRKKSTSKVTNKTYDKGVKKTRKGALEVPKGKTTAIDKKTKMQEWYRGVPSVSTQTTESLKMQFGGIIQPAKVNGQIRDGYFSDIRAGVQEGNGWTDLILEGVFNHVSDAGEVDGATVFRMELDWWDYEDLFIGDSASTRQMKLFLRNLTAIPKVNVVFSAFEEEDVSVPFIELKDSTSDAGDGLWLIRHNNIVWPVATDEMLAKFLYGSKYGRMGSLKNNKGAPQLVVESWDIASDKLVNSDTFFPKPELEL